ncbi:MAG: hypothetical protein LBE83_04585, partial [Propionibacteriaceae bacterium]|nr:hypothetical protein [Propionibacteriaceae bacterium]
ADLLTIVQAFNIAVDLDRIKNKEFLCRYARASGQIPVAFDDIIRLAMFVLTDSALLIKSQKLYQQLKALSVPGSIVTVDIKKRMVQATQILLQAYETQPAIFYANAQRYRKFLILLKKAYCAVVRNPVKAAACATTINRILRKTKQSYVGLTTPVINRVFDGTTTTEAEIAALMSRANTFQVVKLFNASRERQAMWQIACRAGGDHLEATAYRTSNNVYRIRNGSAYIKSDGVSTGDYRNATWVETYARQELITRLRPSLANTALLLPDDIDFALPTSAKSLLGNVPLFTTVLARADVTIGIAWEDNVDLDLHAISVGEHYGWNGQYGNQKGNPVVYSGDMTGTNKLGFAAEHFRIKRSLASPILLSVTAYSLNGLVEAPFQFVVSQRSSSCDKNASSIIDVFSDIILTAQSSLRSGETRTYVMVEPTKDGLLITFANLGGTSGRITPSVDLQRTALSVVHRKVHTALKLRELADLLDLAIITDTEDTGPDTVIDFSPSSLTQSTFVDLLT